MLMLLLMPTVLLHGASAVLCGTHERAGQLHRRRAQPSATGQVSVPPWDLEMDCHGAQCVDASADHRPRMENNSRWTQWAVPEGQPPVGGWPVYIDFLVWPWQEGQFTRRPEEGHCGNGFTKKSSKSGGRRPPPPPPDHACKNFLKAHCPEDTFLRKGMEGEATCKACVQQLRSGAQAAAWQASGCPAPSPPPAQDGGGRKRGGTRGPAEEYCDVVPRSEIWGYEPFDTPKQSMATCFDQSADGTLKWHTESSYKGEQIKCSSFSQWAGQLWNSRLHQYLVANGIAVVLLSPYTSDTWEWYPPELATDQKKGMAGMDQPLLAKLVAMFQDGTYGGLGQGVLNSQKLIPRCVATL
jgi:hypothetical protein